mmetsp:Transcript_79397/g.179138  ORF Transcript_79397/g.179138 Transcript_79397/m.179138 type:complete len:261 (-) Transcript_79397:652-1434(-)
MARAVALLARAGRAHWRAGAAEVVQREGDGTTHGVPTLRSMRDLHSLGKVVTPVSAWGHRQLASLWRLGCRAGARGVLLGHQLLTDPRHPAVDGHALRPDLGVEVGDEGLSGPSLVLAGQLDRQALRVEPPALFVLVLEAQVVVGILHVAHVVPCAFLCHQGLSVLCPTVAVQLADDAVDVGYGDGVGHVVAVYVQGTTGVDALGRRDLLDHHSPQLSLLLHDDIFYPLREDVHGRGEDARRGRELLHLNDSVVAESANL